MSEVKKLSIQQGWFMANGRKYIVSSMISVERFKQYEKLEPLLSYGISFEDIFRNLKKAYEAVNQQRFADSAVIIHNIMSGITDIENKDRIHPALIMCALVFNREGEDTGSYDEALMLDKINDWQKEGYNMFDFFYLALNSIKGFKEQYKEYIQKQSEKILKETEEN